MKSLSSPWTLLAVLFGVSAALAFGGGGTFLASVQDGLNQVSGVDLPKGGVGVNASGVREKIVVTLNFLISFLALIAVIAIIIAGLLLILGAGSDASVQRAKKILIYTLVGLLVIFFSRVIVGIIQEIPV